MLTSTNSVLLAATAADPGGLTTWQALGLFAGVPLLIVTVITAVVVAVERRPRRAASPPSPAVPDIGVAPAVGIAPRPTGCMVMADDGGREIHHTAGPHRETVPRLATPCWTARCTECRRDYCENDELVHFATAAQAIEVTCSRDWRVAAGRLRCSTCP